MSIGWVGIAAMGVRAHEGAPGAFWVGLGNQDQLISAPGRVCELARAALGRCGGVDGDDVDRGSSGAGKLRGVVSGRAPLVAEPAAGTP